MYIFPKTIIIVLIAIFNLGIGHVYATYCPRCVQIEDQRAKEQQGHPPLISYSDNQVSMMTSQDRLMPGRPLIQEDEIENLQSGALSTDRGTFTNNYDRSHHIKDSVKTTELANSTIWDHTPTHSTWTPNEIHYSTLLTILQSKNLINALNGPFTLFIPSNETLHKLPPGTIQNLLRPENGNKLSNLIDNHVVAEKILGKDFIAIKVKTINGKDLDIRVENRIMTVNGIRVLKSENTGLNGIIYIIDGILAH